MDKPLSLETINELADLIGELGDEQAAQLVGRMKAEQPVLHSFLNALDRPPFTEDEFEYIAALGITLWAVADQAGRCTAPVKVEALERALKAIEASWTGRSSLPKEVQRARGVIEVTTYPEPGLLAYLIGALSQKDDPPLSVDARAEAFLRLRIFLDALVASGRPGRRTGRSRSHRGPAGRA